MLSCPDCQLCGQPCLGGFQVHHIPFIFGWYLKCFKLGILFYNLNLLCTSFHIFVSVLSVVILVLDEAVCSLMFSDRPYKAFKEHLYLNCDWNTHRWALSNNYVTSEENWWQRTLFKGIRVKRDKCKGIHKSQIFIYVTFQNHASFFFNFIIKWYYMLGCHLQ